MLLEHTFEIHPVRQPGEKIVQRVALDARSRCFQLGVARGLFAAVSTLCDEHSIRTVVLSGGVFQNELLLSDLKPLFDSGNLSVLTNHAVPPNDGGISLGQAALAAFANAGSANGGEPHA